MGIQTKNESIDLELRNDIEKLSGQKLNDCYLCGKCSAGCPVAPFQETSPHVIMRLAQMGNKKIFETQMIWNCVACGTCVTRCPNDVDTARVCEAAALIAKRQGIVTDKAALAFREKFVDSVKNNGRMHELTLAIQMKLASKDLFSDIDMGLPMLIKGKFPVFAHQIEGIKELQQLFDQQKHESNDHESESDS